MSQKEVKLSWRELNIAYNVDLKTVAQLAEQYGIEWADMKLALRQYGFKVRKSEVKPENPIKPYKVILTDTDKIKAIEEESVTA